MSAAARGAAPARGEALVLCYHAISERWPSEVAIKPVALERQLDHLLRAGYRAMTFSEALTRPVGDRSFAVTFDDAYLSTFELGFPLLDRLGIPATVFVPTQHARAGELRSWDRIDRWLGSAWEPELRGATWDQLRELADAGWEIGSHTRSHYRLPALSDADLKAELVGSRADCEDEIGRACTAIAYPYGENDARVVRAARDAGYSAGATVSGVRGTSSTDPDPLRWPRVGMLTQDVGPRLRAKLALHRHPSAWNLIRRIRRLR